VDGDFDFSGNPSSFKMEYSDAANVSMPASDVHLRSELSPPSEHLLRGVTSLVQERNCGLGFLERLDPHLGLGQGHSEADDVISEDVPHGRAGCVDYSIPAGTTRKDRHVVLGQAGSARIRTRRVNSLVSTPRRRAPRFSVLTTLSGGVLVARGQRVVSPPQKASHVRSPELDGR
jgi:hypothetical protein